MKSWFYWGFSTIFILNISNLLKNRSDFFLGRTHFFAERLHFFDERLHFFCERLHFFRERLHFFCERLRFFDERMDLFYGAQRFTKLALGFTMFFYAIRHWRAITIGFFLVLGKVVSDVSCVNMTKGMVDFVRYEV